MEAVLWFLRVIYNALAEKNGYILINWIMFSLNIDSFFPEHRKAAKIRDSVKIWDFIGVGN